MNDKMETVNRIREFNRFYTVMLGMLDRNFLASPYSVTETRILFEINVNDECSANFLTEKLHIDKSYMSRMIKVFEAKNLVTKSVSPEDGRAFIIHLTDRGKEEVRKLIQITNDQIGMMIEPLSMKECREICEAMDTITKYIRPAKQQSVEEK